MTRWVVVIDDEDLRENTGTQEFTAAGIHAELLDAMATSYITIVGVSAILSKIGIMIPGEPIPEELIEEEVLAPPTPTTAIGIAAKRYMDGEVPIEEVRKAIWADPDPEYDRYGRFAKAYDVTATRRGPDTTMYLCRTPACKGQCKPVDVRTAMTGRQYWHCFDCGKVNHESV